MQLDEVCGAPRLRVVSVARVPLKDMASGMGGSLASRRAQQ